MSVETAAEALRAIARPNVASVQIILNPLRLSPSPEFLPAAAAAGVGIVARVPLAAGCCPASTTRTDVPRRRPPQLQPDGKAFDIGETFAGVPPRAGQAARRLAVRPAGDDPLAACAGSSSSPGSAPSSPARATPEQARGNAAAAAVAAPTAAQLDAVGVYRDLVAEHVHDRW